jgi:hypothetical protein
VAQVLLLALYLDAPGALRQRLGQLVRIALEVRDDDALQVRHQLIGWAFPRRGYGRRSL